MRAFRISYVVPIAMLAVVAAGCSAGNDAAGESNEAAAPVANDEVALDDYVVDVRRDPG